MRSFLCGLLSLLLWTAPHLCHGELAAMWAVGESTKIKADELNHALARGNAIYDGHKVALVGMRNEVVGFQLILVGGSQPTQGLAVRLSAIGAIANGTLSDDPDRYYLGRRIELFEEHYLRVRRSSFADLPLRQLGSKPPRRLRSGLIPDPLVPHRTPITLAPRRNQGFWIDIYIPKSTPAGFHQGTITVKRGGGPCGLSRCAIPVALEVLPLQMPDVPTLKTMLYFSGGETDRDAMPARYFDAPEQVPVAELDKLRARHFKLGRRHRITLFIGTDGTPDKGLAARLDGSAFRPAAGYEGPGVGVPQDLYSVLTYASRPLRGDEARRWQALLAPYGKGLSYFYYAYDEPKTAAAFREVNQRAQSARPLPSFVTSPYRPELGAAIYASPPEHYRLADARAAAAAGHQLWIYHGVRPQCGTFYTDEVGAALRANAWIQYKHRIPRWFYWEATYYNDFQGKRGHYPLWQDALTFTNRSGDRLNGDGVLIYPGRDRRHPKHDQHLDHPLPSIRLKSWRRGIQDVEYLELLRQRGHGAFVAQLLARLLPRSVEGELRAGEPVSWPEDGERWVRTHQLLARVLREGSAPKTLPERIGRPAQSLAERLLLGLARGADPLVRSPRRLALSLGALLGLGLLLVLWRRRARQ